MTAPTTPGGPVDPPADGDDPDDANPHVALGVVFGMLGLALMLTLDDTRVAGLPFVILGATYLVMGIRTAVAERRRAAAAADDGTPPAPPA